MKRQKMSRKLSVTYAILMISLVSVASVLFYSYNRNIIYNDGISNLTQVSAATMLQIDSKLTTMEEVAVSVLTESAFMAAWQEYIQGSSTPEENRTVISRVLTKAYANKSDIRRVTVFSLDGNYISTGKANATKQDVLKKVEHLKQNFDISNRMFISSHKDDWDLDSDTMVLSEIKPIKDRKASIIGFIEVQQNILYFDNICNLMYNNSEVKVLIFSDADDKLFYMNDSLKEDQIRKIANITKEYSKIREDDHVVIATESSNFYQMRTVFILDKETLYNSLNSVLLGIVIGALILLLFTLAYILLVTNKIMQPINNLISRMGNTDLEHFNSKGHYKIKDLETEILTNAFEEMIVRLKDALEKQKKMQDLHTKSIFSILQSEMSPHFLYNALGGIANLCEDNENAAAAEACYSLTEILRYSSDYANTEVTVYDEICNLNSYLNVMKSRYCERLNIVIETDERAYPFVLPKLTYQPIVENAIKYGLLDKDSVTIYVGTEMVENKLVIQIDDNGHEISQDIRESIDGMVQRFLKSDEDVSKDVQFGKMGLGGTIVRLSIFFGERFHYVISGNRNAGTTIRFEIELGPEKS